jgi:two-component system response regulator YesN
MTNLKILIVDDEKFVSILIEKCVDWARNGYDIVGRAETSAEALRIFQKMWPDIVFCDINMPDVDGLALTRQMKKLNPNVHVVLVTGYSRFSYAREAIEIGVDGYVLKPIQGEELLAEADKIRERIYQTDPGRIHVVMRELTQNAAAYIREHIASPDLSLHLIAGALFVSDSHLSRVFKEDMNKGITQYIQIVRMERVKYLLDTTSLPLSAIGEQVGIHDTHYLGRCFKKQFGFTISAYTKNKWDPDK